MNDDATTGAASEGQDNANLFDEVTRDPRLGQGRGHDAQDDLVGAAECR
jgi:hypothetical protein